MQESKEYTTLWGRLTITLEFSYEYGRAYKFRIIGPNGDSSQAIFIPKSSVKLEGDKIIGIN